jgi:oligopeptide/dipeptide ABC transporter ATP-binding protein
MSAAVAIRQVDQAAVRPGGAPLVVNDLSVQYRVKGKWVWAVDDVSFTMSAGEILGIVGESGSGKSTVLRAIARLLPNEGARVESGSIRLGDVDLLGLSAGEMRKIRGRRIGYVFQDPQSALNPIYSVGDQIAETIRQHERLPAREIRERTLSIMERTGIPEPARRARAYPHELSGGLRQRVAIAIALAASPGLLLADEPTTSVDVTIQDQILRLLLDLRDQFGMSVIIVSHDIGVVAQTCERMIVMYSGQFVETGSVSAVLKSPRHPYTEALLRSVPSMEPDQERLLPIKGHSPELGERITGCPFADRCDYVAPACRTAGMSLQPYGSAGQETSCIRHSEIWPRVDR